MNVENIIYLGIMVNAGALILMFLFSVYIAIATFRSPNSSSILKEIEDIQNHHNYKEFISSQRKRKIILFFFPFALTYHYLNELYTYKKFGGIIPALKNKLEEK